jgi:outer membrane protein assembly factor BamB
VALTVLRRAGVAGDVDAIAFDPATDHIYADEDDGTHVFVVDAKTMTSVGTVDIPGHKPEYLAVDPATHDLYQNITDLREIAVIDSVTLAVKRTIPTPAIVANHPLQYDAEYGRLLVGGQNGTIAAYDTTGKLVGSVAIQPRVDQCSLNAVTHELACAGGGLLTVVRDVPAGSPVVVSQVDVAKGVHTVGADAKTGRFWIVWAQSDGDYVQGFASDP